MLDLSSMYRVAYLLPSGWVHAPFYDDRERMNTFVEHITEPEYIGVRRIQVFEGSKCVLDRIKHPLLEEVTNA